MIVCVLTRARCPHPCGHFWGAVVESDGVAPLPDLIECSKCRKMTARIFERVRTFETIADAEVAGRALEWDDVRTVDARIYAASENAKRRRMSGGRPRRT